MQSSSRSTAQIPNQVLRPPGGLLKMKTTLLVPSMMMMSRVCQRQQVFHILTTHPGGSVTEVATVPAPTPSPTPTTPVEPTLIPPPAPAPDKPAPSLSNYNPATPTPLADSNKSPTAVDGEDEAVIIPTRVTRAAGKRGRGAGRRGGGASKS
jgi:hypothetical protein